MSIKPNPFVGPRSLKYREGLYGRDRELPQLRDLLISEQIVLLYSPSGAGKSSLIEAGLRPILETSGFKVLPVARVNAAPPGANMEKALNRYVYSTLASLESESLAQPLAQDIVRLSLPDYVERLSRIDADYVLVLDQFEEIFTVDPTDRRQKQEYFKQLSAVLHEQQYKLWVLIAMREEYLAALDPFCHSIPGYFNVRFRLELLTADAASRAIKQPAAKAGIPFSDDAVDSLVNDFCKILVQGDDGALVERAGEYVEPLHLQVVCRRLWQRLPNETTEISPDDVRTQGNVDEALAGYYEECLDTVSHETQVDERTIRNWFAENLITPQGIRGQILRGTDRSEGMDNRVLDQLVDDYLIRAERRRGFTWYELAHDRLIEPVRQNNRQWRETHLQPWQRTAEDWLKAGRSSTIVLSGSALVSARAWAAEHPDRLIAADRSFLEASAREQSAKRSQLNLKRAMAFVTMVLFAVGWYSYSSWVQMRPWGFLVDMTDGTVHELSGDFRLIGRATRAFKPDISVHPKLVSRIHLMIDRNRRAVDFRTLNGTTVNGQFIMYGDVAELSDDDVLVLANIAPFKFLSIEYPWWRPWKPKRPVMPDIPATAQALLIDGTSKGVQYLGDGTYYVGLDQQEEIIVSETKTSQSLLILQWHPTHKRFAIEDLDDGHNLSAMIKLGETYAYSKCLIPPAVRFTEIIFKMLDEAGLCQQINVRDDYDEKMRWEQPVESLIFYLDGKRPFRVVPISSRSHFESFPESLIWHSRTSKQLL